MSRTFTHKPLKLMYDLRKDIDAVWKKDYEKHCNTKCAIVARTTRRKIRHALMDLEDISLINAISKYKKMSYIARDKYW